MYKKIKDTVFGTGYINDEYVLGVPGEFDYRDNVETEEFTLPTFEDENTGIILYMYKDCLVTFKELRRTYLAEYYKVDNKNVNESK